jgi:hypothetical protein
MVYARSDAVLVETLRLRQLHLPLQDEAARWVRRLCLGRVFWFLKAAAIAAGFWFLIVSLAYSAAARCGDGVNHESLCASVE